MRNEKVVVHYGPPDPQRNRKLFESFLVSHHPAQTDFLYLVPSELRRQQLRDQFLVRHGCCFNLPVLTVRQLLRSLLRFVAPLQILEEQEKESLIHSILASEEVDSFFPPDVKLIPFLSQYLAFFKSRNLMDEAMLRLHYSKKKQQIGPTEEGLLSFFAAYQRILRERSLEDWEGATGRLHDLLLTGRRRFADLYPDLERLAIEGLQCPPPVERGVLSLILQDIPEVHVSLDHSGTEALGELPKRLDYLPTIALSWIRYPPPTHSPKKILLNPVTREQEVLLVVRRIVALKQEHPSLSFSSIAVVTGQVERYIQAVSDLFSQHQIPFFVHTGRGGNEGQTLSLLLCFLRMLRSDFSTHQVFDFILSPQVSVPGLCDRNVRQLETMANYAGFSGGFRSWQDIFPSIVKTMSSEPGRGDPEVTGEQLRSCRQLVDLIQRLVMDTETPKSLLQWLKALYQRLDPLVQACRLGDASRQRRENLLLANFVRSLQAEAAIREGGTLDFEQFLELIEDRVARSRAHSDFIEDAVVFSRPQDIRHLEIEHLFWLGLTEGEFPSRPRRHIFLEGIHTSQWGMTTWRQQQEQDQHLFELLLASAADTVICSWPRKVGDRPTLPSPVLQGDQVSSMSAVLPSLSSTSLTVDVPPQRRHNIHRGITAQVARGIELVSPFSGFFSRGDTLDSYRGKFFDGEMLLSPSRLEDYVQCGYRYFLRRVLRIEPAVSPRDRMALETGLLVHRILRRFMAAGVVDPSGLPEDSKEEWIGRQGERMERLLAHEFQALSKGKFFSDATWEDRREKLGRGLQPGSDNPGLLARFIQQQWDHLRTWKVQALEMKLGPIPLDSMSADDGSSKTVSVSLRGKIDRVDVSATGLLVIDYKTGSTALSRVSHGWGFQLPLYSFMLAKTGQAIRDLAYYVVESPNDVRLKSVLARGRGNSPDAGLLVGHYRDKAIAAARQIYNAQFPITLISPNQAGCRSCAYRQICRFEYGKAQEIRATKLFLSSQRLIDRGRWIRPSEEIVPGAEES